MNGLYKGGRHMGTETIILNAVLLVMICLAAYFGMRFFKSREEIEAISER